MDSDTSSDSTSQTSISEHSSITSDLSSCFKPPPKAINADVPLRTVLDIDLKTKDAHVARDDRMLRLTGSHPFNSEAPLTLLYEQGFITPSQLHFVRNHGPVPDVDNSDILDWTFSVEGMVDQPFEMSVRDMISEFPVYTNPITICCAGNRRKEQNMVKKGKGFNWGPAGVSTSLWTGCFLWDLIQRAKPSKRARFLWMEGDDDPAKGPYGTCVPLHMVRDPERNIMIAFKQNGEYLTPDHGRPLRCVIPGVIGGRSVKWLKRLVVAEIPSTNWYHFYDNKVLPTMVTAEIAAAEDHWWKDERYTIYDLNLQTITVYPEMNEKMLIDSTTEDEEYLVKGFAYNGGGKMVGRVEISLDRGKTWRLCDVKYPEDDYRKAGPYELFGGTVNVYERSSYLCWCFWELSVKKKELKSSKDILVRGMDSSMTTQPRNMYWNLTSMLNNWWYRVAIVPGALENEIIFEHPCFANTSGGWMDRVKKQGGDILDNTWGEDDENTDGIKEKKEYIDQDLVMIINPEKADVIVTREELAIHSNEESPWFVVKGHVFNGTPFLEEHPGGAQSITMVAGDDATEDFIAIHSETSKLLMKKYHIGKLEEGSNTVVQKKTTDELSSTLLHPKIWKMITLSEVIPVSHDSRIFKFNLEHQEQTTGLPVGKHFFIRTKDEKGNYVMRAYTPKSSHKVKGVLEILMKVYFPTERTPGGRMTMLMEDMKIGSMIEIKGPIGEFEYTGHGSFLFNGKPGKADSFLFIAGGSGITPCYQIISEIVDNCEEDHTKMTMFYGNKTKSDILCLEDLETFASKNPNLKVDHCLSAISDDISWNGLCGRLSRDLWDGYIQAQKAHGQFIILVCGPGGMVDAVKRFVKEDGIASDRVVYF